MLELIGFWSVVSLATVITVFPAVIITYVISRLFLTRVLGGNDHKARVLVDKYLDIDADNGFFICRFKIFNEVLVVIFGVLGVIANIVLLVHSCEQGFTYGESLVMFVSKTGELLAPASAYVIIPVTLYYGGAYLVAKGVKLKAKLDTISSKLKEES